MSWQLSAHARFQSGPPAREPRGGDRRVYTMPCGGFTQPESLADLRKRQAGGETQPKHAPVPRRYRCNCSPNAISQVLAIHVSLWATMVENALRIGEMARDVGGMILPAPPTRAQDALNLESGPRSWSALFWVIAAGRFEDAHGGDLTRVVGVVLAWHCFTTEFQEKREDGQRDGVPLGGGKEWWLLPRGRAGSRWQGGFLRCWV
ncbi:hypothetical protein PX52LOC_04407 [Limnoglobus roseus]|uniref:Uncharacterized protein n=1 Tax=Limnoglobus roseus TaxID=2598579 RepID=A0A5C1AKM1_9BACT|nr:hypothetical protein PX52LOC_04407 [Limnoglobus roseus]